MAAVQCRPVELLVQRAPAGTPAAHRPIVEIVEQGADRRVEIGQRKEAPVPQPRQKTSTLVAVIRASTS